MGGCPGEMLLLLLSLSSVWCNGITEVDHDGDDNILPIHVATEEIQEASGLAFFWSNAKER